MADNKPSPSSNASTGSAGGTPQSTHSRNNASRVIVTRQPPTHVYADEWFEVEFDVDLIRGKGLPEGAEFVATLHHVKTGRPVDDEVDFTALPSSTVRFSPRDISPRRKRRLRCKIKPKEIRRDKPAAYNIRLSPREGSFEVDVLPAATNQVHVVNYKIHISLDDEWESVWYKDEGGRDKCMTVTADLLSKDGTLFVGEQVPLQLTLCYDGVEQPVKVSNQDIFRIIGPSKRSTDKRTGNVTLKFRIDDVSKNHQGQEFRVEVATEAKSKGFQDVAPAYTPAVSVRSKRNKRQRTAAASRTVQKRYATPSGTKTARKTAATRGDQVTGTETPLRGGDAVRLREAMKGVMQWSDEVVNGLYPLQWQLIGYAQNPDGSPDFSRPYHSMPNPNDFIQRVLSMYSDTTREHLRYLLNAVDQSSGSVPGETAGLPWSSLRLPDEVMLSGQGIPPSGGPYTPMDPRTRGMPLPGSLPRGSFLPGSMPVPHDKGDMVIGGFPSQAVGAQLPMQLQGPMGTHPGETLAGAQMRLGEMGVMPMSGHASLPQAQQSKRGTATREPPQPSYGDENRESDVAFVLAKQFKANRTGERLGFPAYSESKELIGFYRESSMKVGVGQFVPISHLRDDFGPMEIMQASQILSEAIEKKSDAVYALKDWGSISNLIDHALVYAWSKDISGGTGNSGNSSGGSGD